MKYVRMTIDEAITYFKGNKSQTVMVAVQDLENEADIIPFVKKTKSECERLIKDAETVARVCDSFINQLRVYSDFQKDIRNVEPHGIQSTILMRAD